MDTEGGSVINMKDKRKKGVLIAVVIAVFLVLVLTATALYKWLAPSSVQSDPNKIFELEAGQVAILADDVLLEERGLGIEGQTYVPASVASKYMDQRVYVDTAENILSYATGKGVIQAKADSKAFTLGKEKEEVEQPILRKQGKDLYVSLAFLGEHASCYFKEYKNPSRLIIMSDREKTYTFATLTEDTRVRTGPGKKYPYLVEVPKENRIIIETEKKQENEYMAVTTEDGITGYIPVDRITGKKEEGWKLEKTPESFEQKSLGKTVCLGWHQVTNEVSSAAVYSGVSQATGLNVISPTFFALKDNKGNFSSLANTTYVNDAHAAGVQVWGLINDFKEGLDLEKILGTTSTRTKLVNALVGTAIQYDLDGINVDFEKITAKSAPAYLEFLRELTLKSHVNDLIVSVDNYPPASYNAYYDIEEQGRIVDYVILMAYDEHYSGSEESGSVSSLGYVKNGTASVLTKAPKERVITALPFYTRIWKEEKGKKPVPTAYGMSGAESVIRAHGASAKWDDATGQYYAQYKENGATYKVWLEEETSLKKKLEVVMKQDVAGVAFWKLGFERAATWSMIAGELKK